MSDIEYRILVPGDEPRVRAFLHRRVTSSMFLLNNLDRGGLDDCGRVYHGTWAAAFEAGEIVGVLAHFWNGFVMPQARPPEVVALFDLAIRRSGRDVSGIIGPREQVSEAWAHVHASNRDLPVQRDELDGLYELPLEQMIVPRALSDGEVVGRRAVEGDVELLAVWRAESFIDGLNSPDSPELRMKSRNDVAGATAEGEMWLLEHDGQPVSCSLFNSVAPGQAVQLGGVWTPPPLRGRGYARCVVAASLLEARASGIAHGVLFTGDDNVAAIRAYHALGFRRVGDFRLIVLPTYFAAAVKGS